jgi:hypothetical protein
MSVSHILVLFNFTFFFLKKKNGEHFGHFNQKKKKMKLKWAKHGIPTLQTFKFGSYDCKTAYNLGSKSEVVSINFSSYCEQFFFFLGGD